MLRDSHRVSVVIRCHNYGRFLGESISSALCQTRRPEEIVIVDDGSTDETADVLTDLQARAPLNVLRHGAPRGPSASLNEGFRASSGDLVLALDADDRISENYVERLVSALDASGAAFAYAGVRWFGAVERCEPPRRWDVGELGVENFVSVSALVRRSVFDELGGFRTDLDDFGFEDWEFWLHAVERGRRGVPVDGCWLEYRRHGSGSRNDMTKRDVLRAHLRMRQLHPDLVKRRHLLRWAARSMWRQFARMPA